MIESIQLIAEEGPKFRLLPKAVSSILEIVCLVDVVKESIIVTIIRIIIIRPVMGKIIFQQLSRANCPAAFTGAFKSF